MDRLTITQCIEINYQNLQTKMVMVGGRQFFEQNFFFSDEAHVTTGGYVNKHNCRIWGSENPQVIEERPLNPEKVTICCDRWSEGVIEPYFFKNNDWND